MITISDTDSLAQFCKSVANAEFVTVDTEFMRERTYWSKLCLVQLGGPDEAAIVDALAEGLDLAPLFDLLGNESVLKVFHAARQDIEIFHHLTGAVPAPVFDTQIAAMVCGFGDSVGYETLVAKLAKARIDKSMRFTDWSRRPLSEKQLQYALSDVTHLRVAYEKLAARLERTGRAPWLAEEMATLTSPETYQVDPNESWRRIKFRGGRPRFLCVLQALAAWRERMAQERDVPRNRILRDDVLLDIAARAPETPEELAKTRSVGRNGLGAALTKGVLAAVAAGKAVPEDACPEIQKKEPLPRGIGPLVDLFRVLLKMKCDESGVAQKLVGSMADLERIAADDEADVPALRGWRRELFGVDALELKHGKLALAADGTRVRLIPVPARKGRS
ncbi:MAG: ribonuclease D [Alphaproteobacteria bacterium]|nr:ribonuclease D [Alphaproteobacteria bacterium]